MFAVFGFRNFLLIPKFDYDLGIIRVGLIVICRGGVDGLLRIRIESVLPPRFIGVSCEVVATRVNCNDLLIVSDFCCAVLQIY